VIFYSSSEKMKAMASVGEVPREKKEDGVGILMRCTI
jgi:hypothetical protein